MRSSDFNEVGNGDVLDNELVDAVAISRSRKSSGSSRRCWLRSLRDHIRRQSRAAEVRASRTNLGLRLDFRKIRSIHKLGL